MFDDPTLFKQDQNQFAPRPRAKPQIKKDTNQLCDYANNRKLENSK